MKPFSPILSFLHQVPILALLTLLCPTQGLCAANSPAQLMASPNPAWTPHLLPGHTNRVFTLYGAPSDLEACQRLIATMKSKGLGNGFDPGPTTVAANSALYQYFSQIHWPVVGYPPYGGEFQVKYGRSQLTDADEAALQFMDQTDTFLAIQLGEWGYYFHNLSTDEQWHRNVFGKDFETYRHFVKPSGLKGYDTTPTTRRECYEIVRDYFLTRHRAMRGRTLSVTGHSHYEAYVGEWGSRGIGLELGENIGFTQSKIAFARGASRQWQIPFSIQVSPWFHGSCTTEGPLRIVEERYARGLDAGHSLSFYQRLWLHSWFAGAAMVTPENSISIFFTQQDPDWTLSEHGLAAAETFHTIQTHDPGTPYTPAAIVLDQYNGYNAYQGRPWGILENTPGDLETRDLFQQQLFPGSDHIHTRPDPANPEASYLRATPCGEMFDVILSNAREDLLASYPVLLLVGDHEFEPQFVSHLFHALRSGSRLLLLSRHAAQLGPDLERLQGTGKVEILKSWTNPDTGRPAAISNSRLFALRDELLPVTVSGDPVQYAINRTDTGWIVELINNNGVIKKPTEPAIIDSSQVASVRIHPQLPVASAHRLRAGTPLPATPNIDISIPPGETRFVVLTKLGAAPTDTEAGFNPIFNGRNLDGWTGSGYSVEDSTLVSNGEHGANLLYTRQEFANFILRFDFKLSPGANSGLNIRTDGPTWNEIQILEHTHPLFANILPYQAHGSLYGLVPATRGYLRPVGEWNSQEVLANGTHLRVTLNGHVIMETDLATLNLNEGLDHGAHPGLRRPSGYIGFLGHLNAEEKPGPIWFRNLRVKTLP